MDKNLNDSSFNRLPLNENDIKKRILSDISCIKRNLEDRNFALAHLNYSDLGTHIKMLKSYYKDKEHKKNGG